MQANEISKQELHAGGRKLMKKLKIISRKRWRFWVNKHMTGIQPARCTVGETNAQHWFEQIWVLPNPSGLSRVSLEKLVKRIASWTRRWWCVGDKKRHEKVAFVQRDRCRVRRNA